MTPDPDIETFVRNEKGREIVDLARRTVCRVVVKALELAKPNFWASSFGRIERTKKNSSRHYPKVKPDGYTTPAALTAGEGCIQVHNLINVLFNDPGLKEYECGHTTNHIDHDRSNNDHKNLEWADKSVQRTDQARTVESMESFTANAGLGRLRFVETDEIGNHVGDWSSIFTDSHSLSRATGHSQGRVWAWLNDNKHHKHRASSRWFKYEQIPIVNDDVEREWRSVPKEWGYTRPGFMVSSNGLYRRGPNDDPKMGTKHGEYRDVSNYATGIHVLVCWAFHGAPPSSDHTTVDHWFHDLDSNGCLSNHKDNLSWATIDDQAKNRRSGSRSYGSGSRVCITTVADGTVVKYADMMSAAYAIGITSMGIKYRCQNSSVVDGKLYAFDTQPDMVKARATTTVVDGKVKLTLTTEKEEWKSVYVDDWVEGGKYFCTRGESNETRRKRKRDD